MQESPENTLQTASPAQTEGPRDPEPVGLGARLKRAAARVAGAVIDVALKGKFGE